MHQSEIKSLFQQLLNFPVETEWVEFKHADKDFHFDDIGKYFSALSNEANLRGQQSAWLVFGVTDKLPRKIAGTSYRLDPIRLESLKQEIAQQTNRVTFSDIFDLKLPEGRVLLFKIPPATRGIPTSWKGHYFGRNGESLVALSIQKLETIRQQGQQDGDWTAEIIPDASLKDLDDTALRLARTKYASKINTTRQGGSIDQWEEITFLEKIRLCRNGKITRAALLLLGKAESAHFLLPHPAQITWKLEAEEQAYEHFGPPFFLTIEDLFRKIRNVKFRIQPANHLVPVEITKYDPAILLEGLNNCIAHQDYTRNSRITVVERSDRLTLQNAGYFFDGTLDDYLFRNRTPQRYRNPYLVQAMVSLDMIDTVGNGIRRMFLTQKARFLPLPEYRFDDPDSVSMTLYGRVIDENYTRLLMEKESLSLDQVIALDRIQKKQVVKKETVQLLRREKLIEGRYPRVFIAAPVARAINRKAEYSKHKEFDKQYYKDMILKFLREYGEARPDEIQRLLADKFSDLLDMKKRKVKITNLLQEMSREKLIAKKGARGLSARWILQSMKSENLD
jgi:ATP-dependent DNA helicase RecG